MRANSASAAAVPDSCFRSGTAGTMKVSKSAWLPSVSMPAHELAL